jgi:hypothetical protein
MYNGLSNLRAPKGRYGFPHKNRKQYRGAYRPLEPMSLGTAECAQPPG